MFGAQFVPVLFDTVSSIKPWQENWILDVATVASTIFIVAGTWLWARSGRSKKDNLVPFDHTAESFNGEVYAAYGPVPLFLLMIYVACIVFMVIYTIVSITNGVQY